MAHEIEQQNAGAQAIVAQLSGTLFTLAVRACLDTRPELSGVLGLMASPRLAGALKAMLDAPQHDWTVASLAERCHLCARHLRARVRAPHGHRPARAADQPAHGARVAPARAWRAGHGLGRRGRRLTAPRPRSTAPSRATRASRRGASGAPPRLRPAEPPQDPASTGRRSGAFHSSASSTPATVSTPPTA
ncbi:hypothetical protein [Variovorax sp. UC122_21]|uniref:hypothetical protein n=1 Tax=Variovorax sp. UC122_21 TaxID=3374554 RepID=UPI003756383C